MSSFTREGDITNAPLARGRGASAGGAVKSKCISGGVTSCAAGLPLHSKRREALCSAHQLRFAAHLWTGALAFAAGLHVSAVASSAFILEYSLGANPLLHELSMEEFVAVEGCIEIPDRPGLGVTVNEDFVKRYARTA